MRYKIFKIKKSTTKALSIIIFSNIFRYIFAVYILSSEGHRGVGYDLRRRGIWDWFPVKLDLREQAVTPGLDTREEI